MKKYYWFIISIGLLLMVNAAAQTYERLEKNSVEILLLLSSKDSSAYNIIEELAFNLDNNFFKQSQGTGNSNRNEYESILKDTFDEFYFKHKNITFDSALVLFNQWYLKLNNYYYNEAGEKFFSSQKIKILLFSTSMSCHCTLEMCKNQLIDILMFVKTNNNEYDYLVIDAYENDNLPIKYETLFTPSVIVFNGDNKVIHKIEYDEDMISSLNSYLSKNTKE